MQTVEEFLAEQNRAIEKLRHFQSEAYRQTVENLCQHVHKVPFANPDAIFATHTLLAKFATENGVASLAIACWPPLAKQVEAAEAELRHSTGDPKAHIHKGAPLYNVGLCYFVNGDLENGFHYLTQAGDEDLFGGGTGLGVRLGDHTLSRPLLIAPVAQTFVPAWSARYSEITGKTLDEDELVTVIVHVAKRPMDAIQLVAALRRFLKAKAEPQNDWTRYLRTRALAELLNVLESTLRRKHHPYDGELAGQLKKLFLAGSLYLSAFGKIDQEFAKTFPKPVGAAPNPQKTAAAVNWAVKETFKRIDGAAYREDKAGVACWLASRLRNNLLHVLENQLDIHSDEAKCTEVFGLMLGVLRLVKLGEEGAL